MGLVAYCAEHSLATVFTMKLMKRDYLILSTRLFRRSATCRCLSGVGLGSPGAPLQRRVGAFYDDAS